MISYIAVYRMIKSATGASPVTPVHDDTNDNKEWFGDKNADQLTTQQLSRMFPTRKLPYPENGKYIVQPGDTMDSIRKNFGISGTRLTDANKGIDPNKLMPGQSIYVPDSDPVAYAKLNKSTPYQISWDKMVDSNGNLLDPRTLIPKQIMQESGGNAAAVNKTTGATGLFQIRQEALDLAKKIEPRIAQWTLEDLKDPQRNTYVYKLLRNYYIVKSQIDNMTPMLDAEGVIKNNLIWNPSTKAHTDMRDAYYKAVMAR